MKHLSVNLGPRTYPLLVGKGVLERAGSLMAQLGFSSAPIIISNRRVLALHGAGLLGSVERTFGPSRTITIGDGERFKNSETVHRVYDCLFKARADRHSWIVAFGGGVVGDLAGFAAATFLRGIPFVMAPTTLLSQVDSAIGGKVGINVRQGKNLIGAFHQPAAVLCDTGTLKTLPARELASGLHEVVKCAAIRSEPLLAFLERRLDNILRREASSLQHAVLEAARIKADIVSRDEREGRLRMVLNYGHTVGHALEAATDYGRFKHGEAVGWGMIAAVGFGRERGLLQKEEALRLVRLIQRVGSLPSLRSIRPAAVWNALRRDKKFREGKIRMVLLPRLGSCEIYDGVEPRELRDFLGRFLACHGNIIES